MSCLQRRQDTNWKNKRGEPYDEPVQGHSTEEVGSDCRRSLTLDHYLRLTCLF